MVAEGASTTNILNGNDGRNRAAAGYMLVAVLGSSLIPLTIALGQGDQNPFLFNVILGTGAVLGYLAFLCLGYKGLFWNKAVWVLVWRRLFSRAILYGVISNFNYVLVAWATQYIDISVAAMLFETWLIFAIFAIVFTADLFRTVPQFPLLIGSSLALLAAIIGGLGVAYSSRWGIDLSQNLQEIGYEERSIRSLELRWTQ